MDSKLLEKILKEEQQQTKLLRQMMLGIKQWKEWDKKHHLKEVRNEKLLKEILSKNLNIGN